jgi:hypothetical protein
MIMMQRCQSSKVIVKAKLQLNDVKKALPSFLLDKFKDKEISNLTAIVDGN